MRWGPTGPVVTGPQLKCSGHVNQFHDHWQREQAAACCSGDLQVKLLQG